MANPITPGMLPALLKERFDVIHAHIHYSFAASMAALTRRPLVLTCHGTTLNYTQPIRTVEAIFNRTIGRFILNSSAAIVTSSQQQRKAVFQLGGPDKVQVIPPWADTSDMLPRDPVGFRKAHSTGVVLLAVGRLLPVKGLDYLIPAMAGQPVTLWIVGGEAPGYEGYEKMLKEMVQSYGIGDKVKFLGHIPRQQLADVYLGCDIFVAPTLGEGSGLTILEAMAFGRCCLASDVSTCNELIDHLETGYLVPSKSPRTLRSAIIYLSAHPEVRARLGAAAYDRVVKDYSPQKAVESYLKVFEAVR